ncbi:5-amino-6-(5-phospho-D-ribitylamino)uracil phosphatase, chloroplastic [Linum grandiflorum]
MMYVGADHVLRKVLLLELIESEMDRLKSRLSQLYLDNLVELRKPIDGLQEWLHAVSRSGIPCVVVSSRDRISTAIVSKEDGMESIAHRFLSAAVKLDRKPSKCVVFEDDPRGVTAAHNCTMMAVALIGVHPAYELVQADLAVVIYNELLVINLRRLYANKGSTFMDREKKRIKKSHPK